jgi:hypothetical protein
MLSLQILSGRPLPASAAGTPSSFLLWPGQSTMLMRSQPGIHTAGRIIMKRLAG